jgi:hypothetical protein
MDLGFRFTDIKGLQNYPNSHEKLRKCTAYYWPGGLEALDEFCFKFLIPLLASKAVVAPRVGFDSVLPKTD